MLPAALIRAFVELWTKLHAMPPAIPAQAGKPTQVQVQAPAATPKPAPISAPAGNELAGLPLRYLIGADNPGTWPIGAPVVVEASYDSGKPAGGGARRSIRINLIYGISPLLCWRGPD